MNSLHVTRILPCSSDAASVTIRPNLGQNLPFRARHPLINHIWSLINVKAIANDRREKN